MSNQEISKYTQYLPSIYHKSSTETYDDYFLGRFLKAFEQILTGSSEKKETAGIEELLERIDEYFDPSQTPAQFLQWLAGWVGLELEEGTEFYGLEDKVLKNAMSTQITPSEQKRSTINRNMIGTMVQLYKKRGTCEGLLELLQLYSGKESTFTINEFQETASIGEAESIGFNTMVGSSKPTFFSVNAMLPVHSSSMLQKKVELIRKVIENEKPFYTNYKLNVEVPAMRVGIYSKVGKETLVGGTIEG
jgi:phage tail-like protein